MEENNNMTNEQWLELINKQWKEGNIVYMTSEGPMSNKATDLINQPVEGLLYDLNRDKGTLLTLAKKAKNLRFINDFAVANTIIALGAKINDLSENTKLLNEKLHELTEENKRLVEENAKNKVVNEPKIENTNTNNNKVVDKEIAVDSRKSNFKSTDIMEGFNDKFEFTL